MSRLGEGSLRLRQAVVRRHATLARVLPDRHLPCRVRGGWCYLNLRESPPMLERALGVYERNKFLLLGSHLRPGMSFVDVGANKGDFSVFAASRVGEHGTVVAVEPSPDNAAMLRRSLHRSGAGNAHVVEAALAEGPGEAVLHLRALSGWHTLVPADDAVGEVTVATRRLDDVTAELGVTSVDAVKIDVEGGELGVLRGAERTLTAPGRRLLLLDLHPPLVDPLEIGALLRDAGYRLAAPHAPHPPLELSPTSRELVAWR